ncbi:hypothetical protein OUZ56_024142 [Daphnia magna]|uniref:Uncharacterized protein n=1 Tax=Daphnia magna TaxID=35525 RepID=A0ABR0B098_9CRUS|nr:hypothetical protein OUZ56_024142 [Daphnia magna]
MSGCPADIKKMYSTSDLDICQTFDGLHCVMWPLAAISVHKYLNATLLLFHENGGLNRFNCYGFSTEQRSLLIQPISNDIKDKCIASYQEAVDYNGDLFACGACGVRTYSQKNYSTFGVDDPLLLPLQLKSADVSKHDSLGEVYVLFSNTRMIPNYDFISILNLSNHHQHRLRKKRIPKLSIANGYDYGRIERLPKIQSLTLLEKLSLTVQPSRAGS